MRILLTGAAGFVGSAVVSDLLAAGHRVLGVVRTSAAAATLTALGAEALVADLRDRDTIRTGLEMADAVIHTAFNHDFTDFAANCAFDRETIAFLGNELDGSARPLVVTSAVGVLAKGHRVTEADNPLPVGSPGRNLRAASEEAANLMRARNVPTSVVRLPLSVHGRGDHGFVPTLMAIARRSGFVAFVDEGRNTWPAVHKADAARVYRLAVERGAAHARYHAVAEEGIPFHEIAAAIGRKMNLPVRSIPNEEAARHFGWFHHFAGMDSNAASQETRQSLGWQPQGPLLLDDIQGQAYTELA